MDLPGLSVVMNSSAWDRWAAAKWRACIAPIPALAASFCAAASILPTSRNHKDRRRNNLKMNEWACHENTIGFFEKF